MSKISDLFSHPYQFFKYSITRGFGHHMHDIHGRMPYQARHAHPHYLTPNPAAVHRVSQDYHIPSHPVAHIPPAPTPVVYAPPAYSPPREAAHAHYAAPYLSPAYYADGYYSTPQPQMAYAPTAQAQYARPYQMPEIPISAQPTAPYVEQHVERHHMLEHYGAPSIHPQAHAYQPTHRAPRPHPSLPISMQPQPQPSGALVVPTTYVPPGTPQTSTIVKWSFTTAGRSPAICRSPMPYMPPIPIGSFKHHTPATTGTLMSIGPSVSARCGALPHEYRSPHKSSHSDTTYILHQVGQQTPQTPQTDAATRAARVERIVVDTDSIVMSRPESPAAVCISKASTSARSPSKDVLKPIHAAPAGAPLEHQVLQDTARTGPRESTPRGFLHHRFTLRAAKTVTFSIVAPEPNAVISIGTPKGTSVLSGDDSAELLQVDSDGDLD